MFPPERNKKLINSRVPSPAPVEDKVVPGVIRVPDFAPCLLNSRQTTTVHDLTLAAGTRRLSLHFTKLK